jgi:triosephosphate isomerase
LKKKPFIVGNWKMHLGPQESAAFMEVFIEKCKGLYEFVDIGVAPPFISIPAVREVIRKKDIPIHLCAQNAHWEDRGAFTGEVSPAMLREAGVEYVIIGHSERREYFFESDEIINRKLNALKKNGLKGILCVGEKLEEREAGKTMQIIKRQIEKGLEGIEVEGIVIAYEPVWAIGTGRTASPEIAQEVHEFIKDLIKSKWDKEIPVIYGGSVKPENIKSLLSMKDIDGALVGGASINPHTFFEIIKNCL